jgi:uncharacterized protein
MKQTNKIRVLLELGEADRNGSWPDYLQYGFDETDVPDLLNLISNESFDQAASKSREVWAPLHAWRTLGQLGNSTAITTLITLFARLHDDDWALSELPKVMGMLGEPAITPLAGFFHDTQQKEFARVLAMDGLAEIAKRQPDSRGQIIQTYQDYMQKPDKLVFTLNGLLIGLLLDLNAREAIADIRQFFTKDCVDITCAGDLEDVEIELGFRHERATPKPDYGQLYGIDPLPAPEITEQDNDVDTINFYLMRYGHDDSILDVSELDGFFAALACAPDTVLPSRWMPAIWGGEDKTPAWKDKEEFDAFTRVTFTFYNEAMQSMHENSYEALFLEREVEGKIHTIVDEWCNGFLRGINLWVPLTAADAALTEECIQSIRLFATEAGFSQLDAMSEDEVVAQQQLIEPAVHRLFLHFFEQRKPSNVPYVNENSKIGRNEPCPCGSGLKFKRCCLH